MPDKIAIREYRNILLPRFDTFGDIVLLEGFVKNLMDLFPDATVTLLVREGYDQLASMFPDGLEWLTTSINPYKDRIDKEIVNSLLKRLRKRSYDLMLITTFDRTWLDEVLAAALSSAGRFILGGRPEPVSGLGEILDYLGIDTPEVLYDSFVPVEERYHETDKYQEFFSWLKGKNKKLSRPRLYIPDDAKSRAGSLLSGFGLREQKFIFCFPAGTATVRSKVWGADNFAQVIGDIERKYSTRALVAGHENEKEIVQEVVRLSRQRGANPEFWLGRDGDIPLACALAEKSFFYLGNDTGLMHMAAALNKPVFAIFGGGHWPRFLPCARKGRAFVCPMPCFYCKWDCFFDEALCINSISAKSVLTEIDRVVGKRFKQGSSFKVVKLPPSKRNITITEVLEKAVSSLKRFRSERVSLSEQVNDLAERLRESESDRAERLKQIEDLTEQLEESNRDRAERLKQIEKLTEWLKQSESDREARLKVIEAQQVDIHVLKEELEKVAERARSAEEGWRGLEASLVVRIGRRMGLIRGRELNASESRAENDGERQKEGLD